MEKAKLSLQMARKLKGLNQDEAAKKIGISKDTLGNYERGKSYPDIPILKKIEEVYGVDYDQLIFLPSNYSLNVKTNNLGGD